MVSVEIQLPSLLRGSADGKSVVEVEAETVQGAVNALFEQYPPLRNHLFDEDEQQREHVLIFYNGENTRCLETLDINLKAGDRITILQAVTGG